MIQWFRVLGVLGGWSRVWEVMVAGSGLRVRGWD